LNPILAGTGFCQKVLVRDRKNQDWVSILFLLVLGSVPGFRIICRESELCLNPILAGIGFCPEYTLSDGGLSQVSQSYSCWYWVLSVKKISIWSILIVSILFLLVLGSVRAS